MQTIYKSSRTRYKFQIGEASVAGKSDVEKSRLVVMRGSGRRNNNIAIFLLTG
jgi:hypothetical protein